MNTKKLAEREKKIGVLVIVVGAAVAVMLLIAVFFVGRGLEGVTTSGGTGGGQKFSVTLQNDFSHHLSPGVLVVHDSSLDLNYLGLQVPESFELLAEVGDPSAFITYLRQKEGVYEVAKTTEGPLNPGESVTMELRAPAANAVLSVFLMVGATNDAFAWIDAQPFYDNEGARRAAHLYAQVLDAGTEENSPVGSGFAGGQPDPTRGSANRENGVPTPEDVANRHPDEALQGGVLLFTLQ